MTRKKINYNYFYIFLILAASAVIFNACEQDFGVEDDGGTTSFPDDIKTVFSTTYNSTPNTCTNSFCHSSETRAGGLDLVNWNNMMAGSNNGTMVIPGNSFWSHLVSVVNSDTNLSPVSTILTDLHKMTPDKVNTIINWINSGAKRKDGTEVSQSYGTKCFITNQAADVVSVINTSSNLVTRMIPVGGRTSQLDAPHYANVDPQQQSLYISLIQEGYVERYNVSNYQQTGRLAVGNNPAHIVISPDNNFIYVTNFDASGTERRVKKISTAGTMSVVDTATAVQMNAPHGMAMTNDGEFIYVASQIGEWLFKIRTSDMEIVENAAVAFDVPPSGGGTGKYRPYQCVLSPDNTKLFVTCVGIAGNTAPDFVKVYNANDLSLITSIQVGDNPLLMKLSRNNQYLFVCNKNDSTVTVLNPNTYAVVKTFQDVGIQPHGVDFSSDGLYAYIACETQSGQDGHHPTVGSINVGVTRVINMSDLSLSSKKIEMGSFPAGIVAIPY